MRATILFVVSASLVNLVIAPPRTTFPNTPPNRTGLSILAARGKQPPTKLMSQLPNWAASGKENSPVRHMQTLLSQLLGGKLMNLNTAVGKAGGEPRYVAIGGSLTAGFRNGGLYREAQQTAFPNLIARQMGLNDFQQPLFSVAQGNGSGYKKLKKDGGDIPQYTDIANDLAVTATDPLTFTPFTGRVDNLGMPMLGVATAFSSEEWRSDSRLLPGVPYEFLSRSYLRRLVPADDQQWRTVYVNYARNQHADIATVELGLDDVVWYATAGGYRLDPIMATMGTPEGNAIESILAHLQKTNTKSVVATVPNILRFPYFRFCTVANLKKIWGNQPLYVVDNDVYDLEPTNQEHIQQVTDDAILLPTPAVIDLFNRQSTTGFSKTSPLASRDVLTSREKKMAEYAGGLNSIIVWSAKQHHIPVLDLRAIYDRILDGNYVTDDGLRIDPSFPNGNFFSEDGLYPSALGQAVIANEWIKVMNRSHGMSIPLINTTRFAALVN